MKVKVIKEFVDLHTKRLHRKGEIFECDTKRRKEIEGAGSYIEPVTEIKAKTKAN